MALAEEEPHPAVGEHALLHGESLLVVPPGDPADVALCDTLGLLHTSSKVQHNMRWTVPRQPRVAESATVHQCTALQYTGVPSALHCIPRPGSGELSLTGRESGICPDEKKDFFNCLSQQPETTFFPSVALKKKIQI